MATKYNPFTDALDFVGSGGGTSYIDGDVEYHSDLPVTVGTPAVNSAFLVRKGEGLYFISRKPAGIWVRELNNGNLDDWKYAGTFSDLYRDANFRIINDTDVSKEMAFSLSGLSTATTRVLTVPNKNITIADNADIPTASTATPAALGVAAAGTSTDYSRADHVHAMPDVDDLANVTLTDPQNDDALIYDSGTWTNKSFFTLASENIGPADIGAAPATGIDPTAITGTAVVDSDARLSDARTPTSHTHGSITNDGKLGSTAGLPLVTTTDGAVTTLALGTAGQVLQVNSGATGVEFGAGFAAPPAIGNTTPNTLAGTELALHDGSDTGTFVAASKLTANRTYDLPDRSGTMVVSDTSAGSGSDVVNNIVSLTTAEYNAIGSPDAATLYLITDP